MAYNPHQQQQGPYIPQQPPPYQPYAQPAYQQPAPYGQPAYGPGPYQQGPLGHQQQQPYYPPQQQHQPAHGSYVPPPHSYQQHPSAPLDESTRPMKDRRPSSSAASGAEPVKGLSSSPPWRDKWWAVAFWLQLLAVVIIGGICYNKYHDLFAPNETAAGGEDYSNDLGPLRQALPMLAVCLLVGIVQAAGWLYLMENHGKTLIWITLLFGLVMSAAAFILSLFAGSVVGAVLTAIMFALNLWYVYSVRHKIPFAAAMMDVSLRSMQMFKSAWSLPIIGMLLLSGLTYIWSLCAFSIIWAVDNQGSDSVHSVRGLIFFLLALSLFWTVTTIMNTFVMTIKSWVHVGIAGVQATWYFLAPNEVPENPVYHSVKRASTTSFGSICFGAFIVAFIRTLRLMLQIAYENARESNNNIAACLLMCVECLLGIIEGIVDYINQYAFAICAIYGKPYLESAHEAMGLMRSRGFDAIVNDSLVGGVLVFAQLFGGLTVGVVAGLSAYYGFDIDWAPWAGAGFLIGLLFMLVITEVVESAIICLFICLADDPAVLERTKPADYSKLMGPLNQFYPSRGGVRSRSTGSV